MRPDYDPRVVRAGFLQGGIADEDIPPMVDLLRRFHAVSYLARAIEAWTQADALLSDFRDAGVRYHALRSAGSRDQRALDDALARVHRINYELSGVEATFSAVLGEGSRWMERVVITLLFLAVLTVEAAGLTMTFRISRAISRGLAAADDAARRMGTGDFSVTLPVHSRDELGRLAASINQMGALLDRSYRDLETRVKQRTAELEVMAAENAGLYAEAKAAVQMRDEFISIASHELKTPLTALGLQLDLLSRRVRRVAPATPERDQLVEALDASLRQSARLSSLATGLMDLTAIRVGRLEIHREPCDLAAIVRDVAAQLSPGAARVGVTLEVDADAPTPGDFDPVRMGQVATNLLTNAIKYGERRPVRVAVDGDGERARITVRDQGIGIAAESQERIFERFERVAGPTASPSGLGLGLYIARQIVELHGGRITVESAPGEGSAFVVELPQGGPDSARVEAVEDGSAVARAGRGVAGDHRGEQRVERRGDLRAESARGGEVVPEHAGEGGHRRGAAEGRVAHEARVDGASQAEHVGASGGRGGVVDLLRREVARRPEHLAGHGEERRVGVARDAEIDQHEPVDGAVDEEEVARLDVAVDDARLVRDAERLGRVAQHPRGLVEAQGAAGEARGEVLAVEPVHHQEGVAVHGGPVPAVAHHARVIEARQDRALPLEAVRRPAAVDQELQRHILAAGHVARLEHRSHAAPPRAPFEPVAPGDELRQQPPRQPRRVGQRDHRAPWLLGQATTQPGAHGRQEVFAREGLDEVVVGALVHPSPHLPQVDARAQEDEGHVGRRGRSPHRLQRGEAVHHGHAHVAEHQRGGRRQRQRQARGAVVRRHHLEALLLQHLTDRAATVGVVVDHQDPRPARTVVVARAVAHAGTVP
jgi:signal transduction histidine kinase